MKRQSLFLLLLPLCTGCTAVALRDSTVAQGSTVSAILEEQALENLGRFIVEGDAIPSMVALNTGTITIQNKAVPTYKLPFHFADPTKASREIDFGFEMDWQEAWQTVAVVNPIDLRDIRAALIAVVGNAQREVTCDIALADKDGPSADSADSAWRRTRWLCIDPTSAPSEATKVRADANHWVRKGTYHGHEIWVANKLFADFVIGLSAVHKNTNLQKNNLLLFPPNPPSLQ